VSAAEGGRDPYASARVQMVERQLRRRGILDERTLQAMQEVPRHLFVDAELRDRAYDDHPLPIGAGQTISQPYMVARMTELCALAPNDRVLEVGAGCGYQTAILARLCGHVYAVEIVEQLALRARAVLASLGSSNVTLEWRDGSVGWSDQAPFNAVLVAAGAPEVPVALQAQLADGGRLVIPVGGRDVQTLVRLLRHGDRFERFQDTPCRFVDLRGAYGWEGKGAPN
jgi:protein-L-isoaspartate(D-aspartate) O-methyltransferase